MYGQLHRVIHASPALGDLICLSPGRVQVKRAAGGGRSAARLAPRVRPAPLPAVWRSGSGVSFMRTKGDDNRGIADLNVRSNRFPAERFV